jgi:DNA-binding response OmpR family regulator
MDEPFRKSDRSVDVYVAKLRHKLAEAVPELTLIHTHFGFGYRLEREG